MFMNAERHAVLSGFRTSFPASRVGSSHRGIFEMPNNDLNAWASSRPLIPSNQNAESLNQFDTFDIEGSSLIPPGQEHLNSTLEKESCYNSLFSGGTFWPFSPWNESRQKNDFETSINPNLSSNPQTAGLSRRNLRLTNEFQDWVTNKIITSSTPLTWLDVATMPGTRNSSEISAYKLSTSPVSSENTPTCSFNSHTYGYQDSYTIYHNTKENSSSDYSTFASSVTAPAPPGLDSSDFKSADAPLGHIWLQDIKQENEALHLTDNMLYHACDGLPSSIIADAWNMNENVADLWTCRPAPFTTISPQALTLNSSAPHELSPADPFSGPTSAVTPARCASTICRAKTSPLDAEQTNLSDRRSESASLQKRSNSKPRQRTLAPLLPSNRCLYENAVDKRVPARSAKARGEKRESQFIEAEQTEKINSCTETLKTTGTEPEAVQCGLRDTPEEEDGTNMSENIESTTTRTAKDEFLVRSKHAGMSYKNIRRLGQFTEAESTLRGRYRTLTKAKTERVRKPEWEDKDIQLLKRAVRKLSKGSNPERAKIPWKLVANYISDHGGSYHFGNATCRKRWDELQRRSS